MRASKEEDDAQAKLFKDEELPSTSVNWLTFWSPKWKTRRPSSGVELPAHRGQSGASVWLPRKISTTLSFRF